MATPSVLCLLEELALLVDETKRVDETLALRFERIVGLLAASCPPDCGCLSAVSTGSYGAPDASLARTTPPPTRIVLSERELDVVPLVTAGLSYAQIAEELCISQSTVSFHLSNIYAKSDVRSRHELTRAVRAAPEMFVAEHDGAR